MRTRAPIASTYDLVMADIRCGYQPPPRKARKRKQHEHSLQEQVATYLDRALPPDAFWTSIDSAGRGPRDGARMKRRGVRKGVPDCLIMWRDKPTLWIELKSAKGRWPVDQKRFSLAAEQAGHCYRLCRSLVEVQEAAEYLGIPLRCKVSV